MSYIKVHVGHVFSVFAFIGSVLFFSMEDNLVLFFFNSTDENFAGKLNPLFAYTSAFYVL